MKYSSFFLVCFLMFTCNKDDDNSTLPPIPVSTLSKIGITNGEFTDAKGGEFFPWGFNYTNAVDVGLIEDDWLNESTWQTITSDFSEMKALGANVVRIHLQYSRFMTDANTPNLVAIERLKELVAIADKEELYLDITGLSAYRKGDQPSYYTDMTDEERWSTQKIFWESIAKNVGDSPAVFAFNLMNEPVVSVGCDSLTVCEWTPGDGLGGYHFVQNITREPGNDYVTTFKSWISEMTLAIRSKDSKTLITVGTIDLGNYNRFSDDLDYLSPHMYPASEDMSRSVMRVLENQSDSPLVIEEIYNLQCSAVELEQFLVDIDGKYDGLLGHYFGTPVAELDDDNLHHAIQKNFLQFFIDQNPN